MKVRAAACLVVLGISAPPAAAQAAQPLSISLENVSLERGRTFALRGDKVRIRGNLATFVAGQKAIVRVYRGKRKLLAKQVHVRKSGPRGIFRLTFRAGPGRLRLSAVHRATPELGTLRARDRRITVLHPRASAGSRGPLVRLLQRRLAGMGYAVPLSGVYDDGTGRAIMAWRKVNRRRRAFTADEAVVRAIIARRGAYRIRHPKAGHHAEADLSRQILALVDGKRLHRVYHISSGASVTPTVVGSFRVYLKTPGTNSKGMVHSTYFVGGYAIHGYASVPPFPASHGCLRVPIPNALAIFKWLRYGDRVIVER